MMANWLLNKHLVHLPCRDRGLCQAHRPNKPHTSCQAVP